MEMTLIYSILAMLVLSAFFSGIEIAYVSSNKLQLELESKQGAVGSKAISQFLNNPSGFISTTLVGNTIALVVYGILMTRLLEPVIIDLMPPGLENDLMVSVVQTLISTLIVLATAEFLPKSLFMINPNRMLQIFALPFTAIYWLLLPITWLIMHLSKFIIVKVLGLEYAEGKPVYGLTDLNNYIKSTIKSDATDDDMEVDTRIFHKALEFKTLKVRDCMIPRTEVVAMDVHDSIEELKQTFIESGYSKIIIYDDSIDNIIGYCHALELFKKPQSLQNIINPLLIVPETLPANELMIKFIDMSKSIALVVDEYGGTSGLITIEDVIEEIFGEIQDEHDKDLFMEERIDKQNYLLSARLEISYLNDKYGWEISEGDYDTLGGFILSNYEDIPEVNDIINIPPFTFTILTMEEARIDSVKLTIDPDGDVK